MEPMFKDITTVYYIVPTEDITYRGQGLYISIYFRGKNSKFPGVNIFHFVFLPVVYFLG